MDREQCKGCAYFKTAHGGNGAYRFCHHLLDTGKRRQVGENDECLSWSKTAKKLCPAGEIPPAQW